VISGSADSIVGCLLGTAVGDAFGLPYEGLSKHRQVRLYRHLNQYQFLSRLPWCHYRNRCGGDTDTTAAILGGIIGASVGKDGIPTEWLQGLWEWPRTKAWIELLGNRLGDVCDRGHPGCALPLPALGIWLRNLLFTIVVIVH
jgi:ADP-ribosylglycohydrolase